MSSCPASTALRKTLRAAVPVLGDMPPRPVRFHGRRAAGKTAPLVVHFHGGAFISGSVDQPSLVPRLLADAGAIVMSVDYPLAPQHPFPAGVEAAYATLQWAWRRRASLAGKGAALFVAGEEAGGNIAAAVALVARDRQHPPVAGQILFSPMLDASMGTASVRRAQATRVGAKWADGWKQYLRGPCDVCHPYATPIAGTRFAGLPPLLLLTGRDDPLRDEGRAYSGRLRAAGVGVRREVLDSTPSWSSPDGARDEQAISRSASEALRGYLFTFLVAQSAAATPSDRP